MSFNHLAAVDAVAMHPPQQEARHQQGQEQHHEPIAAADPAPLQEAAHPNANHDFHSRAQVRRAVHSILGRLLRRSLVNVQRREAMMMMAAAGRGPRGVQGPEARGDDRNDGAADLLGPIPAPAPQAGPHAGPRAAPAPRRLPLPAPGVHPAMFLTPRQNRLLLLRQSFLFEDILYKRAISLEEYLDRDTLEDRIFLVGRAVGRAWTLRVERQQVRSARQNGGAAARQQARLEERGDENGGEIESGGTAVWRRGRDGSGRLVRSASR